MLAVVLDYFAFSFKAKSIREFAAKLHQEVGRK
jgi:hypothetical protein